MPRERRSRNIRAKRVKLLYKLSTLMIGLKHKVTLQVSDKNIKKKQKKNKSNRKSR